MCCLLISEQCLLITAGHCGSYKLKFSFVTLYLIFTVFDWMEGYIHREGAVGHFMGFVMQQKKKHVLLF